LAKGVQEAGAAGGPTGSAGQILHGGDAMWQWDKLVYCSGCGVEITWSPRYRNGRTYCC